MSAANQIRIELASSPPCEAFRPRFVRPAASTAVGEETRAGERSTSVVPFILAAALVGFATNLSMHLLNLRMQFIGVSGWWIGVSVAVQALGIILVAPVTKHVIATYGIRRTILVGTALSSISLIGFHATSDVVGASAMRFVFAAGLALL